MSNLPKEAPIPGVPTIKGKTLGGKVKTAFLVPCETLKHALITDKEDPLYDPRASWDIHEPTVLSIKRFGVVKPVDAVKRGKVEHDGVMHDKLAVYDGNQRIINACEAQRRLREEMGEACPIIKIEVRLFTGPESEIVARKGLSFVRRNNDTLTEALLMQKHYTLCQDYEDVATAFGCSIKHVKRQLELASAPKNVQEEIIKGTMSATEAREEYVGLSSVEADKKLNEEGVKERKSVNTTKSRVRRKSKEEGATKAPNKKTISKFVQKVVDYQKQEDENNSEQEDKDDVDWKDYSFMSFNDFKATLAWLTGQLDAVQAAEKSELFRELAGDLVKAPKPSKPSLEDLREKYPEGTNFFVLHRKAWRECKILEHLKGGKVKIDYFTAKRMKKTVQVKVDQIKTTADENPIPYHV